MRLIGTLRGNRDGLGHKIVQKKLELGETYAVQNKNGIKFIKWKDTRSVLIISIKLSFNNCDRYQQSQ